VWIGKRPDSYLISKVCDILHYPEISINRQIDKEWSNNVVWCNHLLYCLRLLQGVTVQRFEYFIFVMEVADKKRKRVVLTTKAKIDVSMRLLGTLRHILSLIS
jgi:hypothetical protein